MIKVDVEQAAEKIEYPAFFIDDLRWIFVKAREEDTPRVFVDQYGTLRNIYDSYCVPTGSLRLFRGTITIKVSQ